MAVAAEVVVAIQATRLDQAGDARQTASQPNAAGSGHPGVGPGGTP